MAGSLTWPLTLAGGQRPIADPPVGGTPSDIYAGSGKQESWSSSAIDALGTSFRSLALGP